MIKSRCHQANVFVYCGHEGTSFYVCSHCDKDCDTISQGYDQGEDYDTGRETEIEGAFGSV